MRFQNTLSIDRFSLGRFLFLLFSSLKIDTIYLNNYVRQTKLFYQFYVCCLLEWTYTYSVKLGLKKQANCLNLLVFESVFALIIISNITSRNTNKKTKRKKKIVNVMCWWCIRHKMNLNICQLYSDFNLKANSLHLMNRTHKNRTCNALFLYFTCDRLAF